MKRAFTLVQVLVLLAVLALLAALLWPVFARRRDGKRPVCMSNLKQIGLAVMQYTQDYDERFPSARLGSSGSWANSLQPYLRSEQLFQCDKAPNGALNTFTTDYFFNSRLSRVDLSKVPSPSKTLLSGDGDDNAPPWNSWTQLPSDALTNEDSPSQRHLKGAMYGYADGHAKWIKPDRISTLFSKSSTATFAVR